MLAVDLQYGWGFTGFAAIKKAANRQEVVAMTIARAGVSSLRQSVLIHEEVKVVIRHCFEINLMGLNAILLAKKAGTSARGFGVVSSELRQLSLELQTAMQALNELTQQLLTSATSRLQAERRWQRLHDAASHSEALHALLSPAMQRAQARQQLSVHANQFQECLAEANRSCTFGLVLARAARIESAYSGQLRSVLAELAESFARQIEAVLGRLTTLQHITRDLDLHA